MSDSHWDYLGLGHNPFSDPQQEFFPGADRELLLNKVRTLDEWSRPVVAVTGPHGVGKTGLFRALSSSLEPGVVAARINGSLVSRAGDVLSALVQGYGVSVPSGADAPPLVELIVSHLKDQVANKRTSLVLVDDAHLLEQRAVDDLVNFAAAGARLAFFSEPQFVESLQRAVERNAETTGAGGTERLLWNEFLLSPFNREQTSEYLEWRFDEAGYNGRMPFSEHQVNGIQRASDGFPGRLDFAANEQLLSMTAGGASTGGIPARHLWLAGALACILGLFLWLWSPEENPADSKVVALEMPKQGDNTGATVTGQADSTGVAVEIPAVADPPDAKLDNVAPTRGNTGAVASAVDLPGSGATDEMSETGETLEGVGAGVPLSRTIDPVEPAPEVPVPSESRTVRVDPEPEPAPKPRAAPVVASLPDVTPAPRQTGSIASASDSARNAAWLLAQNDASFTIQLIGFGEAERAKSYLAEQANIGRFAMFRTRSGDRVVHVVTHGIYASQSEAEAAVAGLPASVGKVTPWIRSIRGVKASIKTALQSDG